MRPIRSLLGTKNVFILAVTYSVVVSMLFFLPTSDLPKIGFSGVDKIVHVSIYIGAMVLWQLYFYLRQEGHLSLRMVALLLGIFVVYGIIVEVCQELFTATREADAYDVLANFTGCAIGIFLFKIVVRIFNI